MIELSSTNLAAGAAQVGVAGDTLNTAVYLRRALPNQAEVHYITALGVDDLSDQMSAQLTRWGIRTDYVARVHGALPGLYNITLDAMGERSFQYWRAGSAASRMMQGDGIEQEVLCGFDVVFLSGISLAILPPQNRARLMSRLEAAAANGTKIMYDSNYRPRLWDSRSDARATNDRMWAMSDVALPSLDDELALSPRRDATQIEAHLAALCPGLVVLKGGSEGPRYLDNGHWQALPAGQAVLVVDSTAAGDSFNAGFIAAHLAAAPIKAACQAGHDLASRVIQHKGAIMPEA